MFDALCVGCTISYKTDDINAKAFYDALERLKLQDETLYNKSEKTYREHYCPVCLVEKKKLAAEIDARIGQRPKKEVITNLQRYDSLPKGPNGFVRAKDML